MDVDVEFTNTQNCKKEKIERPRIVICRTGFIRGDL